MTPDRHRSDPLADQAKRFTDWTDQGRPEPPATVRRVFLGKPEAEGPLGAKAVDLGAMRRHLEEDGELPR